MTKIIDSNCEKLISYTTRPMRMGEECGVDYHYVTIEYFNQMLENKELLEHTEYRGWHYGLKGDIDPNKNYIGVVNPHGFHQIRDNIKFNKTDKIIPIFINTNERGRMIRMLMRGDDIDEIIRRIFNDRVDFDGFENEAAYIINNEYEEDLMIDVCHQVNDIIYWHMNNG